LVCPRRVSWPLKYRISEGLRRLVRVEGIDYHRNANLTTFKFIVIAIMRQ
jgi:hypothetical protein